MRYTFFLNQIVKLDYKGFSLNYDLEKRIAHRFTYELNKNSFGNVKRPSNFYYDPTFTKKLQQDSLATYHRGFDRGHLVPSGHMNKDQFTRKQSHYITKCFTPSHYI